MSLRSGFQRSSTTPATTDSLNSTLTDSTQDETSTIESNQPDSKPTMSATDDKLTGEPPSTSPPFEDLEEMSDPVTLQNLGKYMLAMGVTLKAINSNLTSLNESVHNLEIAKDEIRGDITKLRSDTSIDLESTKSSFSNKLTALECKITDDHIIRFNEIIADLDAQKLEYTTKIEEIKASPNHDFMAMSLLKDDNSLHAQLIKELRVEIEIRDKRMDHLESLIHDHINDTNSNISRIDRYADETRELANQLEAHGRRWAIRIFGLTAPKKNPNNKPESPDQAKTALLNFLAEKLEITDITPGEIDTAHRVGPVNKEGNQTLLVRFFRRELVDYILTSRKLLKGKNASIFQDTTQKNRKLIFDLNKRPEVEGVWCQAGFIWVKLHSKTQKIRVGITTNLDKLLAAPNNQDSTPEVLEENPSTTEPENIDPTNAEPNHALVTQPPVTHDEETKIKQLAIQHEITATSQPTPTPESTPDTLTKAIQREAMTSTDQQSGPTTTTDRLPKSPQEAPKTLFEFSQQSSTPLDPAVHQSQVNGQMIPPANLGRELHKMTTP
jgi:hypothetical protein